MKNYGEENGWEIDVDFPSWGNNEIYIKTISKTYLQSGEKPKDAYWRVATAVAKRLDKPQLATKFLAALNEYLSIFQRNTIKKTAWSMFRVARVDWNNGCGVVP